MQSKHVYVITCYQIYAVLVTLLKPATLVVIGADSTYTPEKYQSSAGSLFTRRRTPKCQSAELVEVEAEMFSTTFSSAASPSDAHNPTVCALKSMSSNRVNVSTLNDWRKSV